MSDYSLHIVPWHNRWAVKAEVSRKPLRLLETKEEAVAEAQDMARHVMFAHIYVYGEDGIMEREIPAEEKWTTLH